jgi:DNA/RNA-binding domain of Phe-tRNA-synthetase-like protein
LAFATPIAVFDVAKISNYLEVRYATGSEQYLTFAGETETPEPKEVVFADESGRAHARRWTYRQSAYSVVGENTTTALIVAEAMHASANSDMARLLATTAEELNAVWSITPRSLILSQFSPRFDC